MNTARTSLVIATIVSAAIGLGGEGGAAEHKGEPNLNAKLTADRTAPSVQATDAILLARQMADYGARVKSPLALACAAEILLDQPTTELTAQKTSEGPASGDATKTTRAQPELKPAALLALAKTYAAGDATVLAALERLETRAKERPRGAVGGPKVHPDQVLAGGTDIYTVSFRGSEAARVVVIGDGDCDLDLFIFDENGRLITSDTDTTDRCVVEWLPRWTGPFKIVIKNLGRVYADYVVMTN